MVGDVYRPPYYIYTLLYIYQSMAKHLMHYSKLALVRIAEDMNHTTAKARSNNGMSTGNATAMNANCISVMSQA